MKKVCSLVLLCLLSGAALGMEDLASGNRSHQYFRRQDGTVTTIHEAITVLEGLVIECEEKADVSKRLNIFIMAQFDSVPSRGTPSYNFETLAQTLAGYKTIAKQKEYIDSLPIPPSFSHLLEKS